MKKIIVVFLFLLSFSFYAQEKPVGKENSLDTTYVKDLRHKFMLKVYFDNKTDSYFVFGNANSKNIQLLPNVPSKISFSFNYQIVSFALSLPSKWSLFKEDDVLKGKTDDFSFEIGFVINKWYQSFNYSDTKGYYVNNTGALIPSFQPGIDPYLQFPNLRMRKIEGETAYIINGDKYSYRAYLHQTQIQKKSAGSLIPSISYSYLYSSNKDSDLNAYEENVFSMYGALRYQYTGVISKSFSISGGGNVGLGFRNSHKYLNGVGTEAGSGFTSLGSTLELNLNLNYQTEKFFSGLKVVATGTDAKQADGSTISNNVGYGVLYFGYRFDAPHIVSRNYSKAIKKINVL